MAKSRNLRVESRVSRFVRGTPARGELSPSPPGSGYRHQNTAGHFLPPFDHFNETPRKPVKPWKGKMGAERIGRSIYPPDVRPSTRQVKRQTL